MTRRIASACIVLLGLAAFVLSPAAQAQYAPFVAGFGLAVTICGIVLSGVPQGVFGKG